MTLIQCCNTTLADNIPGCLYTKPGKLILLGSDSTLQTFAERYRAFLQQRTLDTELLLQDISGMDVPDIAEELARIVASEKDCVIDLTGGSELVIMASGALIAGLDRRQRSNVSIWKFDPITGTGMDCIGGEQLPGKTIPSLCVSELIALHGGIIHPGSYQPPVDCRAADLDPVWRIVSQTPKDWNRDITLLGEFESRADSKTQVFLPLEYISSGIRNFEEKEARIRSLLEKFYETCVVDDYSSRNALSYAYTSRLLRYATLKAGNALEVKTLLEAREARSDGAAMFHDCQMSVNIDWDGIVYDPADRIPETRNEVDLILIQGLTPLFISCKNGNIGDDELYKLHTVASRFGGPYAKKMLIATDLDRKSPAADRAFIQRAWDMDIFLVTDAGDLTKEGWKQIFTAAML